MRIQVGIAVYQLKALFKGLGHFTMNKKNLPAYVKQTNCILSERFLMQGYLYLCPRDLPLWYRHVSSIFYDVIQNSAADFS